MSDSVLLLGISGSLRAASLNTALLRAMKESSPAHVNFDISTLSNIPLYNADVEEAQGLPESVVVLRKHISKAHALVFASPEYNSGMSGVLKNALDWVSRTSAAHPGVLAGKPVALVGATPGGFGTLSAQAHALPVLRALGMIHWSQGRLMISKAHLVFGANGLSDNALAQQIQSFTSDFADFTKKFINSDLAPKR